MQGKKGELYIKERGRTIQMGDYIQTKGGRKAKLPGSWQEKWRAYERGEHIHFQNERSRSARVDVLKDLQVVVIHLSAATGHYNLV